MAQSGITDLMSLFSDLVDFWRSAHEALLERRRKRADRSAEECNDADARDAQPAE